MPRIQMMEGTLKQSKTSRFQLSHNLSSKVKAKQRVVYAQQSQTINTSGQPILDYFNQNNQLNIKQSSIIKSYSKPSLVTNRQTKSFQIRKQSTQGKAKLKMALPNFNDNECQNVSRLLWQHTVKQIEMDRSHSHLNQGFHNSLAKPKFSNANQRLKDYNLNKCESQQNQNPGQYERNPELKSSQGANEMKSKIQLLSVQDQREGRKIFD